jgi:kinesin family protein 6/9
LAFDIPHDVAATGVVNNNKTQHRFTFTGILDMEASQDHVFAHLGQDAITNALDGFNSTILAYGQTSSGKTFTITGGPERYADRGLIPRALQMVFREIRRRGSGGGEGGREGEREAVQYQVYVSYLEVYNEVGCDLLAEGGREGGGGGAEHEGGQVKLPRVALLEDEAGNCHLKGLSMHAVSTEEEALNLLFVGDTNRAISETAMNQASSRSHCLFTLSLEGRKQGGETVRRSKLNLVDLAGSERVHKTGGGGGGGRAGQILKESKYINQSLFYLEMVILALHEKRTHVPYRNSMMTSVLRDSLGGNCKTVMVATVSTEKQHTEESLSTCRFAMRVGQIRNEARRNEDVDPYQVIKRLQTQLVAARAEVGWLKEGKREGRLEEAEKEAVRAACREFVMANGRKEGEGGGIGVREWQDGEEKKKEQGEGGEGPGLGAPLTLPKIYYAFRVLREMVWAGTAQGRPQEPTREEEKGCDSITVATEPTAVDAQHEEGERRGSSNRHGRQTTPPISATVPPPSPTANLLPLPPSVVLQDATQALAFFRLHHYPPRRRAALEEDTRLLKGKFREAKALGERVQKARHSVTCLRKVAGQLRRWKDEEEIGEEGGRADNALVAEEEAKVLQELEQEKKAYHVSYEALRDLKGEIEGVQRAVDAHRVRLQAAFDPWYAEARAAAEAGKGLAGAEAGATTAEGKGEGEVVVTCTGEETGGGEKDGMEEGRMQLLSAPPPRKPLCPLSAPLPMAPDAVEDDIAAFYRAKEELLLLRQQRESATGSWFG